MKQMYAITVSGGQYEDQWTNVDSVTDDLDKGQAYVNKMNSLSKQVREAQQQLANFHNDYHKKNPYPYPSKHELKKIPKWNGNEKITTEMRDERKKLELENLKIREEANQPILNWAAQFTLEKNQWLENNFTQEVRTLVEKNEDLSWDIEPAKWLN